MTHRTWELGELLCRGVSTSGAAQVLVSEYREQTQLGCACAERHSGKKQTYLVYACGGQQAIGLALRALPKQVPISATPSQPIPASLAASIGQECCQYPLLPHS
eukprot:363017-Chlamydomonas_euryale.AAC.5